LGDGRKEKTMEEHSHEIRTPLSNPLSPVMFLVLQYSVIPSY